MTDSPCARPVLRLKKNEDRRLRAGHLWVYSNEVDTAATPLKELQPGQALIVQDHRGQPLGSGYGNPHSLICARLISRDPHCPLDAALLEKRLGTALVLRQRLYPKPFYRLAYGEADGLPGLVVDRFADICVAQITTAGMERLKDEILCALRKILEPSAVLWRNDSPIRDLEGLPRYVEAFGPVPETTEVEEQDARFEIPLLTGQKTGWFFDQRDNRARVGKYARGCRVLDVFSYVGGFGIQAALHGASQVLCVDSSAQILDHLTRNATLNRVGARVDVHRGDAFSVLKSLRENTQRFAVIILDPPTFIRRNKDMAEGVRAYRRLNDAALQLLSADGVLVSCSCSQHLPRDGLVQVMWQAARRLQFNLQILEQGRQSPDHPVHPAIPETEYLKVVIARRLPP